MMQKEWDLNIFFKEDWDEENGTTYEDVLTINPVVWTSHDGITDNTYTDIIWKTTFSEARYLRSQYPINEYGDDWTDTLEHFIEIAPPRLKSLAMTLPSAYQYKKAS